MLNILPEPVAEPIILKPITAKELTVIKRKGQVSRKAPKVAAPASLPLTDSLVDFLFREKPQKINITPPQTLRLDLQDAKLKKEPTLTQRKVRVPRKLSKIALPLIENPSPVVLEAEPVVLEAEPVVLQLNEHPMAGYIEKIKSRVILLLEAEPQETPHPSFEAPYIDLNIRILNPDNIEETKLSILSVLVPKVVEYPSDNNLNPSDHNLNSAEAEEVVVLRLNEHPMAGYIEKIKPRVIILLEDEKTRVREKLAAKEIQFAFIIAKSVFLEEAQLLYSNNSLFLILESRKRVEKASENDSLFSNEEFESFVSVEKSNEELTTIVRRLTHRFNLNVSRLSGQIRRFTQLESQDNSYMSPFELSMHDRTLSEIKAGSDVLEEHMKKINRHLELRLKKFPLGINDTSEEELLED